MKKILFVDDEPNFLNMLRRMLHNRSDEWNMFFADSVDDAITELSNTTYDLIITDMNMPTKNGYYFLELLNYSKMTKYIPVVILTGMAEQNLKRQALNMGAIDLMTKPILKDDLIARIESLLRLKLS